MIRAKFIILALLITTPLYSQFDEDKTGAWYMYFFNGNVGESRIGFQGDFQYRNWNLGGDLEQLLLRGGVNFQPEGTNARFTLGYGHVTSGAMGEETSTTMEHRIYQEALLPQKLLTRYYLTHRFRYEQRFVENQDFRTRYRYTLFINVPLNVEHTGKNAIYLALYNELFINGERDTGNGNQVEIFDRNRTYLGIGYGLTDRLKIQAGWMNQVTDTWMKGQVQLSLHHSISFF